MLLYSVYGSAFLFILLLRRFLFYCVLCSEYFYGHYTHDIDVNIIRSSASTVESITHNVLNEYGNMLSEFFNFSYRRQMSHVYECGNVHKVHGHQMNRAELIRSRRQRENEKDRRGEQSELRKHSKNNNNYLGTVQIDFHMFLTKPFAVSVEFASRHFASAYRCPSVTSPDTFRHTEICNH